jgi:glycosyltransferase involved in cell wall biosynthesis
MSELFKKVPVLYIVIPCYNEEAVIGETVRRLTEKMDQIIAEETVAAESRFLLVNDGSRDQTWPIIQELCHTNPYVTGISLAHNKGHQNALLAGLMTAKEYADIVISMDADLQDDIQAVDRFVAEYKKGADIVYGVRSSRKKDTFFKRTTALTFYKLMAALGVETVYNHADYRLMSKRALDELEKFKEVNLFLRGIIPMIGFRTATVEYERAERYAGESKYPLSKMIAFAIEGITSCSVKPLRLITLAGIVVFALSLLYLIYVIIGSLAGHTVPGWATLAVLICFFGGAQILCIGIVGEYIGKIYNETKARPRYIIAEKYMK